MDLLAVWRTLTRRKLIVVPLVLLIAFGCFYVIHERPSVYEADASLLLVIPRHAPTPDEIARDPTLEGANYDNPYTRLYDPGVVVNIVSSLLDTKATRAAVASSGGDPRYTVGQTARYGFTSPVAEIKGVGPTPEIAMTTARLVAAVFKEQLRSIQAVEGVDPRFFIDVRTVDAPDGARLRASDKLRALVAVVGLGAFALFVLVSLAEAVANARAERLTKGLSDLPSAEWIPVRDPSVAPSAPLLESTNGNGTHSRTKHR
jgi:hypothetical protein